MHGLIKRAAFDIIIELLNNNPAVAMLGPRQCGKTTLAKVIIETKSSSVYLDLEYPPDVSKLHDPAAFFEANKNNLVCLDEVQRVPELFKVLRSIIDRNNRNGQVLILGSASRELIRQSSETLAGRIAYFELSPFLYSEAASCDDEALRRLRLRGGYPRSFLAASDAASLQWRNDFIRTYLERDIPQLGFSIPAEILGRLWTLCAHLHGQAANYSRLGESLGVSHNTIRSYISLLSQTFILRLLQPFHVNTKKRLVKSPKIFIRDSGLLHALLRIESFNDLLGHPVYGYSWEGFVIENILYELPGWQAGYYKTQAGAEIDLVLQKGSRRIAIECKSSTAPQPEKGFWNAADDLDISEAWIVAPVDQAYPFHKKAMVAPLGEVIDRLK